MNVNIAGEVADYPKGTSYLQIAKDNQKHFEDDIVLVTVNGRLQELSKTLTEDCQISFVTTAEEAGKNTYRRSVTLLMQRAIHNLDEKISIKVLHSIGQGYYCEIDGCGHIEPEFLRQLKTEMNHLVEQDLPIVKESIHTEEAVKLFHQLGMTDKEKLFRYRLNSSVNVYKIGNYVDYYYGYMVPSTGYLQVFDLFPLEEGFVIQFPNGNTRETAPFEPSKKLFSTLRTASRWGSMVGVGTLGDLNEAIAQGKMLDIMLVQEALMEKRIGEIAGHLAADKSKKFIMIAGPSSSGKTSFSHRLSIQLMTQGMKPHPIPLDDYYLDRDKSPRDENGQIDFECLEALDVELFNHDMTALLNGEEVELPTFNFKTGKREYHGNLMKLGSDDVLVIEGIHGLNDKLSYTLPKESKYKIYISALTQLNVDEHNCLHTTDGRLLRRIVRDARTRNTTAKDTIAMWKSVRRGEEKYIFPFQEDADVMFNSAFLYELAVIKPYAAPLLYQIQPEDPEYAEAKRLLKLLDYVLPVPSEDVLHNSLFREFIGGSCFNV